MICWTQDFLSDDWGYEVDGKLVLWVRKNNDTGRDAFEVTDPNFNRIGGLDATEDAAKARAVRIHAARASEEGAK